MRRFIQPIGLCLALLVAGSMIVASAQNQQSAKQNPSFVTVRRPDVNTTYAMLVIRAAEYAFRHSHGRFGSWQELYDSGTLWDSQKTVEEWRKVAFANGPEAIPGYRLSLMVSADGAGYSISLRNMDSDGCGLSLFSDQSGPVYQGVPLDCPKAVDK